MLDATSLSPSTRRELLPLLVREDPDERDAQLPDRELGPTLRDQRTVGVREGPRAVLKDVPLGLAAIEREELTG